MLPSLLLLLSLLSPPGTAPGAPADWTAHPLIAHALGGIDGNDLTNSSEAFEANYAKGFRVFEADLILTSDQRLVARHDWEKKQYVRFKQDGYIPNLKNTHYLTLDEFLHLPILNKYNAMSYTDLLLRMVKYPDAYLVLDTKFTDERTIRKQYEQIVFEANQIDPALLERIVPQLYNQQMLKTVDAIYPFPSYIYTLYQSKDTYNQVADFVRSEPRIKAVTMAESRVTKAFIQSLSKLGVRAYVHTVNNLSTYRKYQEAGVFGIYTDFISYSQLLKGMKGQWTGTPPAAPAAEPAS